MTLYDNRPTDFFSATHEFHGHPNVVFRSSTSAIQVSAERMV